MEKLLDKEKCGYMKSQKEHVLDHCKSLSPIKKIKTKILHTKNHLLVKHILSLFILVNAIFIESLFFVFLLE